MTSKIKIQCFEFFTKPKINAPCVFSEKANGIISSLIQPKLGTKIRRVKIFYNLSFIRRNGKNDLAPLFLLKILSSQKRGWYRGVSIDLLRLPHRWYFFWTLKGLIFWLNRKKSVPAFRAKKMLSLFWYGFRYQKLRGVFKHCITFVGSDMWSLIIENVLCGCKFVLANRCPELGHAWTNQGNVSWIYDRLLQAKWRYSQCRHHSCNDRQSLAIAMYRTVEYENKKQYFWNSVARLYLPLKTRWRH